jgi:anti-sigma B factor antagonist
MALKVAVKDSGEVTVMMLSGRITLGDESNQLRNRIKATLGKGKKYLVLDLGEVTRIDSAGLGTLVSSYTTVSNAGGQLKLANLTKKFSETLAITKLVTVFDVYDSVDEAVRSFETTHF